MYELLAQLPGDYFTLVFEITERGMVEEESALAEFDWLHKQGHRDRGRRFWHRAQRVDSS